MIKPVDSLVLAWREQLNESTTGREISDNGEQTVEGLGDSLGEDTQHLPERDT